MSQPINPYEPPRVDLGTTDAAHALEDASAGVRLLNVIIDNVICQILNYAIGMIVGFLSAVRGTAGAGALSLVIVLLVHVSYYVVLEGTGGRTVGKLITGTRVVNEAGGKPTLGQIVGRTFARYVPFEAFSFLGSTRRGWHDRWSGTHVIKLRS